MRRMAILLMMLLVACTAPPEDVAKADISEVAEVPSEVLPPTDTVDEVLEPTREEVPIDMQASSFEFEGFAPGKSHVGTFEEMTGVLFIEDGQVVGGSGLVDASSVKTDNERVDAHLQNEDFFDVENCPTIEFTSTNWDGTTMTGDLTFHCITKEVSFPATVSEEGVSADFVLDLEPFKLKYAKISPEARITFNFVR